MKTKTATIDWAPFSLKHKKYIASCALETISIAEGAVRSGKTIDHCIAAAAHLELCKDRIHLASGSTVANAKLNIGDCNGYGLEHLFRNRCYWGKYKGNDALIIFTQTGEKIVVFAGAAKANSFQKILGNSYGLWIATEINQHHISFIQTSFSRQLAAYDIKTLWDLNPGAPTHWIYTEFIDPYRAKGITNYQHFTMDDNLAISAERKVAIKRKYDPESVWYKRDILGERCVAEGLIYRQFADQTESYIQAEDPEDITLLTVGVDFGGNKSAHAFIANALTPRFQQVITVDEYYKQEKITPKTLEEDFVDFCRKLLKRFPKVKALVAYCDSAETTLIQGLKLAIYQAKLPVDVQNALKGPITGRVDFYNSIIAQDRYKVMRHCTHLIGALQSAVWDPKNVTEDVRLDDGIMNIDSLDACEYTTERLQKDIQQMGLFTDQVKVRRDAGR